MADAPRPVLELRGITKKFGSVVANDRVDFDVYPGEVHALLGENGAGKSTLVSVLYGLYTADEGEILVGGRPVEIDSPATAIRLGIGMVHQHFMLVPVMTVAENIVLGQEPTQPALYRGACILVLDEPTAVLTAQEVQELIGVLNRLKQDGTAIVFISHKVGEVLRVADRITVLRHGKKIDTVPREGATEQSLARLVVGRDVLLSVEKGPPRPAKPMLEVEDLHVRDDRDLEAVNGASMEVRGGEIVAIAGVDGNGQQGLHVGLFIALAAVVVFWVLLNRTRLGYEVRAVGFNPDAASYAGIRVAKNYFRVMAICGAFAGIAASMDVLGWKFNLFTNDIQASEIGFLGIAVALLGRNTAIGTVAAALLFGGLLTGTSDRQLDPSVFNPQLASNLTCMIHGIIVLLVSTDVIALRVLRSGRGIAVGLGRRTKRAEAKT